MKRKSFAAVFAIAYYHSKTKKVNQLFGAILATSTFLLITNTGESGTIVDATYLGSAGIFTAIIVAFGVIWILGFFKEKNLESTTGGILPELVGKLLAPLFAGSNTLWFAIIVNVFINFMWFFGIHGFNIVVNALWQKFGL
jgi:PTS system cellobiose-specific IIC component